MDSNIGRKDLDLQDNDNVELKKRLLGATTEIGTGIGTDFLTGSLLNPATIAGTKGLSILAYAGINGFQGAYTNYLVQKHLYGADNVNWGEILSSGALSAIPFMDLKAGKNVANIVGDANTLRRGIVGGAGLGLAGEQLRVGMDEQRLLSPLEASMAIGLGGGIGGAFKLPGAIKNQRLQRQFGPGGTRMKFQRRFIKPDGTYDFEQATQVRNKLGEGIEEGEGVLGLQGVKNNLLRTIDSEDYKGFSISNRVQGALGGSDIDAVPLSPRVLPENATTRLTGSLDLLDNSRKLIYKRLDDVNKNEAEQIIFNIEQYINRGEAGQLPGWSASRPTFAFPGKKTLQYTKKDGTQSEMGFRWSASQETINGKGAIVPYDVQAAEALVKKRYKWDQPSSVLKRKQRNLKKGQVTIGNANYDAYMKWLRQNDPELYFRIIEDTKSNKSGSPWYVEHLVAQKAKIWEEGPDGIFYHKFRGYAAGDPENMAPIFDSMLGRTKTALEKFIYSKRYQKLHGKHFGSNNLADAHYVDFDLEDLIIRSTYDNAEIYRISVLTNPDDLLTEVGYAINRPDWWVNETEAARLARLNPKKRPELGITDQTLKKENRLVPPKSVEEFEALPDNIQDEIEESWDYLAKADKYYGEDVEKFKSPYVSLDDPNLRRDAEARYDLFKDKVKEGEINEQLLITGLDEYYISQIMIRMFKASREKFGG